MAQYNGKVKDGKGGIGDNLLVSFLANAPGGVTLDNGKVIPQIKGDHFKATDAEKVKAHQIWDKLTKAEKQELTDLFTPEIVKFRAKKLLKNP